MVAAGGGLLFDSLSANPLGITVLPLLLCGLPYSWKPRVDFTRQTLRRWCLVSARVWLLQFSLLLLLTTRHEPCSGGELSGKSSS